MESTLFEEIKPLLKKYYGSGPRYTSYPPATEWQAEFEPSKYENLLKNLKNHPEEPLSLYLHIPFCKERCLYCACNVIVRKDHLPATLYIEFLKQEIRQVSELIGFKPKVNQLHFGGGTPTFLFPEELSGLMDVLDEHFEINYKGEVAIEIDPVETSKEYITSLCKRGFNRFSFGVQDFNHRVQEAVHRVQSFAKTAELIEEARTGGAKSINVDLIYGLPLQTLESFYDTMVKTMLLNPDRIAMFSYAHVPWMFRHQQLLDELPRPDADDKLQLLMMANVFFSKNNMMPIGLDHFTRKEDELFKALHSKKLQRNFMGYTVQNAKNIIGFGNSAIGFIDDTYIQNDRSQIGYENKLKSSTLPVETGYEMVESDFIRKQAIMDIMIYGEVLFDRFKKKTGKDFVHYFADDFEKMEDLFEDELIELFPDRFSVTTIGKYFLRTIAMRFDEYQSESWKRNKFSNTI